MDVSGSRYLYPAHFRDCWMDLRRDVWAKFVENIVFDLKQIQKYRHCNVLGKDEQAPLTNIILFERWRNKVCWDKYQIQVSSLELVKIMSLPRN